MAALAPASVRPPLRKITGFFAATCLAILVRFLPSEIVSRYMEMTSTSSSLPKYSNRSFSLTSHLLPIEQTLLTFRLSLATISAAIPAANSPDWPISTTLPLGTFLAMG
ncbi:MAG: hypothetical protein ACD_75C02047G0003 [uncultured bacterium]|nr:MAG: hypothetical protein ACD_75C02047G0003 [uncultured bacterium]